MIQIYPSVMAKDQRELDATLKKLKGVAKTLHLDIGDGKFVPQQYGWFTFKLSENFKYNAHLMVCDPESWIRNNGNKVETIIFHPEPLSGQKILALITQIKSLKKKVGLALKPETNVASIKKYLFLLDHVLILTVHPGSYGAKYLPAPLRKIALVKQLQPTIKVIVDGGMRPETIGDAVRAGADAVVSGSFITKAEDPKKALRYLRTAAESTNI
ncbi:ribulose-phosphate 3-epimerase [Candidatus Woesearchaeota archaeon]|nr:ribulose-phosphate 3-epimerase [Candidatus Woesearchaeota archaeon]